MLTGSPPWTEYGTDASTIMQVIQTTRKPPKLPTGISEVCEDFLKYCFIMSSKKRPTIDELSKHPFVVMSDQESRKSSMTSQHLVASVATSLRMFQKNEMTNHSPTSMANID